MNLVISARVLPASLNKDKYEDYRLLTNMTELKNDIEKTPKVYNIIYADDESIAFNSVALNVFKGILTNGFIDFNKLVYITREPKTSTDQVFKNIFIGIEWEVVNVKEINNDIVTDVVNGRLGSSLGKTVTTFDQVKIDDYIKQNGSVVLKQDELVSENIANNLGLEEIKVDSMKTILNIVAFDNLSMAVLASLIYSNLSVNSSVFMMEYSKYNYLSDYMIRLGIKKYTTDINQLTGQQSDIFLREKMIDAEYDTIFDFIYNNTNYNYYIKAVDPDKVTVRLPNMYIVLQPTPENVIRLLKIVSNFNSIAYNVVLLYKGFIGSNELTQQEMKNILMSVSRATPKISSYVMTKDGEE